MTAAQVFLPAAAVLFDCDGVLVDSDADVVAAWSTWATGYGLDPQRVVRSVHGRRTADTVAEFFGAGPDADAASARIDELERTGVRLAAAVPGAVDLVRSMDAADWAVVTSGRRDLAQARLDVAGLWPAPVLVGAQDVTAGKPAPDCYLRAADAIGVAIGATVVVEDTPAGVQAARSAGVGHVVGIGARAVGTDADVVVPDLRPLRWTGDGLRIDPAQILQV